ncbi:MAG TPA: hydrogenase expression/formation protein HypE, partial [Dehalococcoidia bacterium]|nr:hydrogenase expression/formation protein HypE [Dehalococcoidia bacterium]
MPDSDKVLLAHGSGGKLAHEIVRNSVVSALDNPILNVLDDSAVINVNGRLAF